jgi:hypothetical protein
MNGPIEGRGYAVRVVRPHNGMAYETSATNLIDRLNYLYVTPVAEQSVVWYVPGNDIRYDIESNTNWNIE